MTIQETAEVAIVVWRDACSAAKRSPNEGGWATLEELPDGPSMCVSVGLVLREDEDFVQLVGSVAGIAEEEQHYGGDVVIPKGWIHSDTRLTTKLEPKAAPRRAAKRKAKR